jgi:phosphoribosylaminoimidazole (AIR) synthetase
MSHIQQFTIIYSRFVSELTGGFDTDKEPKATVTGIAHITGGGQPSKLGRMLEVQRLREFTDEKAYGKWHMGPGMVIATPEPEKVLAESKAQGIVAQAIGQVTDEPGIRIKNRGAMQQVEWLSF